MTLISDLLHAGVAAGLVARVADAIERLGVKTRERPA
jgi:hypothetical protein